MWLLSNLIHLGMRIAVDPGGDCGAKEYAFVYSQGFGTDRFYDAAFRAEVRWIY